MTSPVVPPAARRRRTAPVSAVLAAALAATLALAGCGGGDGGDGGDGPNPGEVLAAAKKELDATSGVQLGLTTPELPDGVDGVLEATGVGTHAPAFDGEIKVSISGVTANVPVVAVGGTVHAKLPLTTRFAPIDPAEYGAPDPARLMATDGGVSSWLTAAEGVTEGDQTRSGDAVLTSYTGTLPGDAVTSVIPSADETADFDVTFLVDADDRLTEAQVSGPFYGDAGPVDYTVTLDDYGIEQDITAP